MITQKDKKNKFVCLMYLLWIHNASGLSLVCQKRPPLLPECRCLMTSMMITSSNRNAKQLTPMAMITPNGRGRLLVSPSG